MSWKIAFLTSTLTASAAFAGAAITQQSYEWANVVTGVGGGFIPGIVFNPSQQDLVYARTDIGGVYKRSPDSTWKPLLDTVGNDNWDQWGVDAIATDPINPNNLYLVRLCHYCNA